LKRKENEKTNEEKLKNFSQKFFENFKIKIRINRSKFVLLSALCGGRAKNKKGVKKYE
jgi:hypothetical protein